MLCLTKLKGGPTMKTTITAKKMQIPQNFTEYAEKRIDNRLGKFLEMMLTLR